MGVRLYMAREELGVDRGSFAQRLGIDRNTITRYEGNRVTPREIVLRAWARETGVDLEWLRTGVPSQPNDGGAVVTTLQCPERDSNSQPTDCAIDTPWLETAVAA